MRIKVNTYANEFTTRYSRDGAATFGIMTWILYKLKLLHTSLEIVF
jgi:hypothetical protein